MDAGTRRDTRRSGRGRAVAALALATLMLLPGCKKAEEETKDSGLTIGYATQGVTVTDDADELQRQVDEMYREAQEGINLEYKNTAYSVDGQNFSCYIANNIDNAPNDLFIAIYEDEINDEPLYLSQLLRPGQAFESITLDRAIDPGNHEFTVAFSLVETAEDGTQTMLGQALIVMDFVVTLP